MLKKRSYWIGVTWLVAILLLLEIVVARKRNHSHRIRTNGQELRTLMRVAEYRSLREEINNILKRGFEIYFATLSVAIGLLGYGITVDELWISLPVILSPLLLLHLGFLLILEQVRTVRRNASYIRIFHEGSESNVFWETCLYKLREQREKEQQTRRRDVTVADILKGFPTIIDIISSICLVIFWLKCGLNLTKMSFLEKAPITWWGVGALLIIVFPIIGLVTLAHDRHRRSKALQGAGEIEREYTELWGRFRQEIIQEQTTPPKKQND